MFALSALAALITLVPLLLIFEHLLADGVGALDLAFFTQLPRPVGEPGGGMANSLAGTLELLAIVGVIGLPISILAGVFLSECRGSPLASVTRFTADVLTGVPSIVAGIVIWVAVVRRMGHFSGVAGGLALSLLLMPMVVRTTEEVVRRIPGSLREAGLALGLPYWRTTVGVVLPSAAGGIATGALVALARVAGETAPLLFTAFGNRFWQLNPLQPIAALPLQVFQYAISPYDDWHRQAWAASLVLISIVLVISIVARVATRTRHGRAD
ncbi:MAG: phosphate ABC transporter permease PstA [Gemmatimonadota bacterium]